MKINVTKVFNIGFKTIISILIKLKYNIIYIVQSDTTLYFIILYPIIIPATPNYLYNKTEPQSLYTPITTPPILFHMVLKSII